MRTEGILVFTRNNTPPGNARHKRWFTLGLLIVLSFVQSCGHLRSTNTAPADTAASPVREKEAEPENDVDRIPSLPELMSRRRQLCTIDMANRLRLLGRYRGHFVEDDDSVTLPAGRTEQDHQLDALILSSCNPARTPGILGEMLVNIRGSEEWPPHYQELFNWLAAHQRAYSLMEDQNRELHQTLEDMREELNRLQREYHQLKIEHEETIRGISEIERGIE